MSTKQDFTVGYILGLLKYCSQDAHINIVINKDGEDFDLPITSILIHETQDKKELISFLHEKDEQHAL